MTQSKNPSPAGSVGNPTEGARRHALQAQWRTQLRSMLQDDPCQPSTIETLLAEGRLESVAAGTPVAWAGQPMPDLLLVVQGALEVSRVGLDGRRHVTSYPGPRQWFGLIPIIDGHAAVHDAWAHGDALLFRVPRASFLRCLDVDKLLNRTTMLRLCQRSRVFYDALADDGLLTLRARTARVLERIASGFPQPFGSDVPMRLAVSQDVIGDMLGVTRQSANQQLKQLERDGLVRLERGVVELLDRIRLRAVGNTREALPRSAVGKVLERETRERYWRGQARRG